MLIAILADTHLPRGGRRLPGRCVECVASAELLVHAGDFVAAPILDELEAIGPPMIAVHGNVDSAELRRRLPQERAIEAAGLRIGLVHDAGPARARLHRLRRRFPDADAAVFGHSHLPLLERDAGFQIFNPGSPTERRRAPRHTMGIARIEGGTIAFEHVLLD